MRHLFIILAFGTALTGCEKQKEQLEKFVFDNSQVAYRSVHKYMFDKNGRIKTKRSISYQYMAGIPFDSTITETTYEYNDKGLLISAVSLPDSIRQVKIYNKFDSLIGDYRINEFGDTTDVSVTVYNHGKVIRRINRHLNMKLPANFENLKREDFRIYDTMLFITDLIYDKDVHTKSIFRTNKHMIKEETELYYENDKLIKTITYAFFGDTKYVKETTFYEKTEGDDPDFVSIGIQGDTIATKKTIVKSDGKVILNYDKEFGMQDIWYYNNAGQLIATAVVDVNTQERTVSQYTYDSRGNTIEEIAYRERLKQH